MRRPPLWAWALPAAMAVGLLIGLRLRPVAPTGVPAAGVAVAAAVPRAARPPAPPAARPDTQQPATAEGIEPDSVEWGLDGGSYRRLDGSPAEDTLPAAPRDVGPVPVGSADPVPSAPLVAPATAARPVGGPAQALARDAALTRPLVAVVRDGGRLTFYSAWDAPASRASLVGEWSEAGSCADVVRLGYEQVVGGLGVVRGVGDAEVRPRWETALVVPRQHCASAAARWRPPRAPRPEESALLAPLLAGEAPRLVLVDVDRIWAASAQRAVVAQIAGERATELWSAIAPEGASMRLLGRWEGHAIWVAVVPGGRVAGVWRAGG